MNSAYLRSMVTAFTLITKTSIKTLFEAIFTEKALLDGVLVVVAVDASTLQLFVWQQSCPVFDTNGTGVQVVVHPLLQIPLTQALFKQMLHSESVI